MVIRIQDSAPGDKGTNQSITPHQSFTDLVYSKGKRVTAIVWVPGKKGMVAVACTQPLSADERLENAGRVENSAVLIWNFLDPIHPQYVLEAPFDVFSFGFNPAKPEIITGGLHNGQVRRKCPLQRRGSDSQPAADPGLVQPSAVESIRGS